MSVFLQRVETGFNGAAHSLKGVPVATWRLVVMALALVCIVYSVARLVWLLLPVPELQPPSSIALQAVSSGPRASAYTVDLALMQAEQIFGESSAEAEQIAEPETAREVEENVEKTRLNLTLVGVLASSDTRRSSATIANGAKQDVYKIDDTLPVGKNVKLAKVLANRVILDNNGNFEALWLFSDESILKAARSQRTPAASTRADTESSTDSSSKRVETKLSAAQVPKSINDVVRFSVHREGGRMVGFRVRPGKNREVFEQVGLKPNDIVTSVNGIPIDTPQAIRDNYAELKSANRADLEVKRGEELLYINVALEE